MKKIYALIIITVAIVFCFDYQLKPGTDIHYYMDLAYYIHSGQQFLVDYFDYRIPVFAWLFSWVYDFNFSEFINRYIMLVCVYSLYLLLLWRISFKITGSKKRSLLVIGLSLLTITSHTLDIGRDMTQPLFHHTLELASVFIIVYKWQYWKWGIGAGLLAGLAFIGRQVHLFPFLVMLLWPVFYRQTRKFALSFWLSATTIMFVVISHFLEFDPSNFSNYYYWLWQFPQHWHNFHKPLTTGIMIGLLEFRNIRQPLFLFTYGYYLYFTLSHFIKRSWPEFNHQAWLFLIAILLMTIINIQPTGIGPARYEGVFITVYSIFLSILLGNKKSRQGEENGN